MCRGSVYRTGATRDGAAGVIPALSEKCYLRRTARRATQKLCPYLHVVSLLRDQIPGRARNPDNSSFDPVPVGSTILPSPSSRARCHPIVAAASCLTHRHLPLPLTLSARHERTSERKPSGGRKKKKNNRRNTCRALEEKNRGSPVG